MLKVVGRMNKVTNSLHATRDGKHWRVSVSGWYQWQNYVHIPWTQEVRKFSMHFIIDSQYISSVGFWHRGLSLRADE